MNFSKERFSIEEVKEMDLVNYLSGLGYHLTKIRNADDWYLSPLRNERTPSFKVNRKISRWYNHRLGKGGKIVDFGMLYHECSLAEFLQSFDSHFSFHQAPLYQSNPLEQGHKTTIPEDLSISSFALAKYLEQRKIPFAIAERFCREILYDLNGKTYCAIGFKNNSGGYELRNPYFKGSSSPKDITIFDNGATEATVFEGFIDFLSFMAIHKNQSPNRTDFVILNSVSFFEKARPFMEQHTSIRLYLDRDTAGQNCSNYALSLNKNYTDESCLYKNHKDLNGWLVNVGRAQKKTLRQKL